MTTATAATDEIRRPQHGARTQRKAVEAEHQIDRSTSRVAGAASSVAATRLDEFVFLAVVGAVQVAWLAAAAYALTRLV
jgi:hypothetical protein